jgi:heptosyltransferase-1
VKQRIFDHQACSEPRRVLITRLSAIGDCILTIPLAVKIKQLWPACHVSWVVDCAAAALLEPHAAIDEVLRIEKRWLAHAGGWSALRNELTSRQFDLVFDPQGLSKSALLGKLSGAKTRVGFDYSHGREIAPLLATHRQRRTVRHMVDTYLQLLAPWCPISAGTGEFQMPIYTTAVERVEGLLQELDLKIGSNSSGSHPRWLAINVGAGWPSKQWPPERFGWIAQELRQRHGLRSLVLWAGDSEQALAEQVLAHAADAAVMAPATSLCELAEIIRRCAFLVSGDTSALHIASALNTPCVGLFGPTWSDESGSYGNKHIAIQSSVLPDSSRGQRRSSNNSMNAIEISEVLHACVKLWTHIQASATSRIHNLAA